MRVARRTDEQVRTEPREVHDGSECEVKEMPRRIRRRVEAVRRVVTVSKAMIDTSSVRRGDRARTEMWTAKVVDRVSCCCT